MKTRTDASRADDLVSRVHVAFRARTGLLRDQSDLVEHQIPPRVRRLSRHHANFLFFAVANDHGVRSRLLYERARAAYSRNPSLFRPNEVVESFTGPEDSGLLGEIAQLGVRYPRESARSWFVNAERLRDSYGGEARNLFVSTSEAAVLFTNICAFRGYGAKTGAMLLRAIAGLGFGHLHDLEKVLIPVDIHDTRICAFTNVVDSQSLENGDYYRYADPVRRELSAACRRMGLDWLTVDRGLWLIGSRGCVTRQCQICPLETICSVGQSVRTVR